jgi:major membrane immunogen (membrane-anchored lipoprotein)
MTERRRAQRGKIGRILSSEFGRNKYSLRSSKITERFIKITLISNVMTIKKTLASIVLVAAIGLSGCGKGDNGNSNQNYHFQRQPTPIAEVPVTLYRGSAFTATDFDNDGDIDILAVDCSDGKVYLHKNENGQFYKSQNPIAEVPVRLYRGSSIAAVDWDKDGKIDILAVDAIDGKVFLYKNTQK